ncbi:MAG: putative ABC transporter permease [Acutalibacteraceae bacterium]|nr:putative ABC transporter permease [Acutalibacteraceae bacterium]
MISNIYQFLYLFFIYSFLGWCIEVIYVGLNRGHFVNRGFLSGPYCSIYGFGVLFVVCLLNPIKDNLLLLFVGSALLTTSLELITGWLLDIIFHQRWWDYSNVPFNIKGYVCLKFAIIWGLGCLFVVKFVHPNVLMLVQHMDNIVCYILLFAIIVVFIADNIATITKTWKYRNKLVLTNKIADDAKRFSDVIGQEIFDGASEIADKVEDVKEYIDKKK